MSDFLEMFAAKRHTDNTPTDGLFSPATNHTPTSDLAAAAVAPHTAAQRMKVLAAIVAMRGATRQQVEEYTALDGNSVRPRVRELVKAGWVEEGPGRKPTASGQMAVVLLATSAGLQAMRAAA